MSPLDPEVVRAYFHEFAAAELATGGPDPQVLLAARAAVQVTDSELDAAKFIGCFVGPYTCGAAGPLWQLRTGDIDELTVRISKNWDGLPRRRERRAVDKRSGEKLATCLLSWATWCNNTWPSVRSAPYADVYQSVQDEVQYYGRYATMKAIECLFQAGLVDNPQDSVCAAGAKYPRRLLAWMHPEGAHVLENGKNDKTTLTYADEIATYEKALAPEMSWFAAETIFCNSRQAMATNGSYPGRSHDRELAHFKRAEAYWGPDILAWFPFYELRAKLFPHEYLGELGNPAWYGAREELQGGGWRK